MFIKDKVPLQVESTTGVTVPSPQLPSAQPDLTNGTTVDGVTHGLAQLDTTEDKDAAFDAIAATTTNNMEQINQQEEEQRV